MAVFVLLVFTILLYKNYERKQEMNEIHKDPYNIIKKYLLKNTDELENKQQNIPARPILWIHVPYEYNARNWESWGSRSSHKLNQPYLYLTVKSIVSKCDKSFTICMIDDDSFDKLIPNWNINMNSISSPITDNMRTLAHAKLIKQYGGMICPISFLCMRDLIHLYNTGTRNGTEMFVCDNVSHDIHSANTIFTPDLTFFGAPRNNPQIENLCEYISRISGRDFTAQTEFLGKFSHWCNLKAKKGEINIIPAETIGRKTKTEGAPILIEHLLGNNYLDLDINAVYGIYIPANEILSRRKFEWFARSSPRQIMDSDTIIGNYIMLSNVPIGREDEAFLEPLKMREKGWVGFWRTPLLGGLWGTKPNFLGDNLLLSSKMQQ